VTAEFVRYSVAGGMAFVVDAALLFVFKEHGGLHYLVAAAIAYAAGVVTTYLLNSTWVFRRRRFARRPVEFALFVAIALSSLGLNELLMWVLTDHASVHYMISKAIATGVLWFYNYGVRRWILFTLPSGSVS
jgi:putative flippase GtrA